MKIYYFEESMIKYKTFEQILINSLPRYELARYEKL